MALSTFLKSGRSLVPLSTVRSHGRIFQANVMHHHNLAVEGGNIKEGFLMQFVNRVRGYTYNLFRTKHMTGFPQFVGFFIQQFVRLYIVKSGIEVLETGFPQLKFSLDIDH
ncbi:hypothetical protein TSUD_284990 [Trifolium subterraneum]|uniref:Uncharacterized protein n=1 Tax=Trifolium subterraneum TaxID=3900 RepID=A0A2Z6PGA8_TRISU|nr:hypothetical protein TSUD_284990 [Trifolium subterraneum]